MAFLPHITWVYCKYLVGISSNPKNLCYKVFCKFFGDVWVYLGGEFFLKH